MDRPVNVSLTSETQPMVSEVEKDPTSLRTVDPPAFLVHSLGYPLQR